MASLITGLCLMQAWCQPLYVRSVVTIAVGAAELAGSPIHGSLTMLGGTLSLVFTLVACEILCPNIVDLIHQLEPLGSLGDWHYAPHDPIAPVIRFFSGNRNPAQDKRLSDGEIKRLGKKIDIHKLKGGNPSKKDLFKDKDGNIYTKPKSGTGPGDETGLNINDY